MGKILLCIDDQPIRYKRLRKLTSDYGVIVVTTCRLEDVNEYLRGPDQIVGVCLDHDMPFQSGAYFAEILREKNYPVAITSMNPDGAAIIKNILDEYETPNKLLPCSRRGGWEYQVFAFLGIERD
jgi:CheY-like chemotaxis protein